MTGTSRFHKAGPFEESSRQRQTPDSGGGWKFPSFDPAGSSYAGRLWGLLELPVQSGYLG